MSSERPVCLTVIGWGTIVLAILMGFGGAMAGVMSMSIPDSLSRPVKTPTDFIFQHFMALAALQVVFAALLLVAGRSLLLLQKWAARVIEGTAWLGLMYLVGAVGVFMYEFHLARSEAPHAPPTSFVVMMSLMLVFIAVFWSTPLILTIRNLRSERVRSVLA